MYIYSEHVPDLFIESPATAFHQYWPHSVTMQHLLPAVIVAMCINMTFLMLLYWRRLSPKPGAAEADTVAWCCVPRRHHGGGPDQVEMEGGESQPTSAEVVTMYGQPKGGLRGQSFVQQENDAIRHWRDHHVI